MSNYSRRQLHHGQGGIRSRIVVSIFVASLALTVSFVIVIQCSTPITITLVSSDRLKGKSNAAIFGSNRDKAIPDTPSNDTTDSSRNESVFNPSGKNLSIAVVTTSYYSIGAYNQFSDHFISKSCYAARHGYDFYLDSYNRLPDRLHPKFSKTYDSLRILPKYDWLFFSDDDVLITGFDQKLEDFVEGFGDVDVHLLVPKDKNGDDNLRFSNYAFFIKNSEFSMKFMRDWFESYRTCHVPKPHSGWPDQSNMWLSIVKGVYEYYNLTVPPEISEICNKGVSRVNGLDLVEIYQEALAALNFTTAQSVNSDRRIRAPVAWSEIRQGEHQSGLGLQGNHGMRMDQSMYENGLSLHLKAVRNSSRVSTWPHFIGNLTQCFGKFHLPNMTIVEDHAASAEYVPIESTKNLKLHSTLQEYTYGHRRSLHRLPPRQLCFQATSYLSREGNTEHNELSKIMNGLMEIPVEIQVEFPMDTCTDYRDISKWDYKRHTVYETSRFVSTRWKVLLLRDPVVAFISRFAEQALSVECKSDDALAFIDATKLEGLALEYMREEETRPFMFSVDNFIDKKGRVHLDIAKARLREFVTIIDPSQWTISKENVMNALGVELIPDAPPNILLNGADGSCSEHIVHRLRTSEKGVHYDRISRAFWEKRWEDFELLRYARDMVLEQNEFFRLVPARGEHLYLKGAELS